MWNQVTNAVTVFLRAADKAQLVQRGSGLPIWQLRPIVGMKNPCLVDTYVREREQGVLTYTGAELLPTFFSVYTEFVRRFAASRVYSVSGGKPPAKKRTL